MLEFETMVKEHFDFDFQKDLIEAVEGTALVYGDTSLTSPRLWRLYESKIL